MFRTKQQVDHHVQEVLRKCHNETERNLRCYNIAQQYYKVRAYESARNYLSLYLSVKEDSPLAYKLQGQILEGIGDKTRALDAYKTSLEYDANQPELVLKMCELLCETEASFDLDRANYWCERGTSLFPHDPVVFRLKEKLLKMGGQGNSKAFEELINSEMKARPSDVTVRIRLMRLYLETGRTKAAFNHAVELESNNSFPKELVWYECFAKVCQSYVDEFPSQVDWQLYCTWISVLDKVASLSLSELGTPNKIADCALDIYRMDQVLFKGMDASAPKEYSELYNQFQRHMSAQLCFHIATLILKKAKKESNNWREATNAALPLLFMAQSAPPDTEAPWFLALTPSLKQKLNLWINDAVYRLSQAGYILLTFSAKEDENKFVEKVSRVTADNWRNKIFQKVFLAVQPKASNSTSYFVRSKVLDKMSLRLPSHDSGNLRILQLVPVYEKARETLHHLVWLGLQVIKHFNNKLSPDFHTYSFSRLKFTALNLNNISLETLSVLDVDAFLYATVFCAAANLEQEVLSGFYSNDRPLTLPADISNLLCTQDQMNWWESVRKVNSQQFPVKTNMVALRQQLQRGIEVIRAEGNHGLDVQLIVKLARTFSDRASSVNGKNVDQSALEARASLYWNAALPLLEKLERNQAARVPTSKLFQYHGKDLTMAQVSSLLEEGRFFVGCLLMKSDQHEKAIETLKPLRSPYASFNMALIYKKLAASELEEKPREEITSEMRSKHVILLSKARECLNLTFERIRIDRKHPLHQTLQEHIAEVDSALSRIEPDPETANRSGGANISEVSLSSMGSLAAGDMGLYTPKLNGHDQRQSSTPRHSRHHISSDYKRSNNHIELVNVSQLLQVQTLHEDIKKMQEKLELVFETMNELRRDVNKMKSTGAEDLYLFGEDEEYPEEVLGQYPPTFVTPYPSVPQVTPTFYPPPTRGVQGTSTVTYGAPPPSTQQPPVIPLLPLRMPLEPTLASYQNPQNLAFYNQGTLPFPEAHLPDFLRQNISKQILPQQPNPPPVNVVITTSDTLPTGPPPVQPTLSVTIPPQHRLGTLPQTTTPNVATPPHKFQIPMPATATIPNLEKSPIVIPDEVESEDDTEINNYDPCPDFRPIIPLPKEVSVTTGEEEDDVLFENRAKLYRFVETEWKERGVGIVKILKNRTTSKVRLLMRREQVHKICANHLLKPDMELTMKNNSDRALIWVANDFAEEVLVLEKFCIKFKTTEEALKFRDVFNEAKVKYGQSPPRPNNNKDVEQLDTNEIKADGAKLNVGGFTFTSPPKLKEPMGEKSQEKEDKIKDPKATSSPFAGFSFIPQKPMSTSTPTSVPKPNTILKPSGFTTPMFAGLNSTQNKHTLFEDVADTIPSDPSIEPKGSSTKVPNEVLPKTVQTPFQSLPANSVSDNTASDNKNSKNLFTDSAFSQPNTTVIVPPKPVSSDSPKSILKEPLLVSSSSTTPVSSSKSTSSTKHVFFQDNLSDSSSQQTPTLVSLLTSPNAQVVDFAALSKVNEDKQMQFGSNNKSSGFAGAGSTVFGSTRTRNESEGENAEEFVPNAEFKPVVPLPELVEVKTGEEGQEIVFNERAKLMRYEPNTKEWKERGLGQMKVLKDPITGITRLLMRRELVLKVCCNHRIIQSLELKASPSSEKAWTWYAVDYSEGEPKNELFAIRFKTVDLAKAFKETVDSVQKQLREEGMAKRSCPDSTQDQSNVTINTVKTELPKLSELFRPKSGSWECKACYTINGVKEHKCVSCDSPKEKPKSPGPASPSSEPQKVTSSVSLSEMFKPKPGSWECKQCLVRNDGDKITCLACSQPKPGHEGDTKHPSQTLNSPFSLSTGSKTSGFNFGLKNSENSVTNSFTFGIQSIDTGSKDVTSTNSSTKETGFVFGSAPKNTTFTFMPKNDANDKNQPSIPAAQNNKSQGGGMFMFGNATTPTKPSFIVGSSDSAIGAGDKFTFGQGGKFEFNFSGVKSARSPGSGSKSPRSPVTGQETDSEPEEVDEGEGDHIEFKPVVPLPDKVEVTTGEENEEVLYSHRAKLYRFSQGEWKERGLGDLKILRHNDTHKIRLLMRREPILKICLNHFLTSDLVFTLKDDRSWLWCAPDFSEGQITNEQFCLRLKTPETATDFKKAIDSAQGELEAAKFESTRTPNTQGLTTNEVEIVYEAKVTEELRQAALKLHLPPNFYNYLTAAPCPGCPGCEPDSEDEDAKKRNNTTSAVTSKEKKIGSVSSTPASSTTTSVYQPFTFTVQTTTAKTSPSVVSVTFSNESSKAISSTSIFSSPTHVQSNFTFTMNSLTPTVLPEESTKTSVFGGSSSPQASTNISSFFGGSPSFQSQPLSKSVFGGSPSFGTGSTISKPSSGLLFGTTTSTVAATTLSFGQSSTQESASKVDEKLSEVTTSVPNVFATPTTTFFNSSSQKGTPFLGNLQPSQKSLFGGASPQSSTSLFGTPVTSQPPLFGGFTQTPSSETREPTFLFKNTTSFSDVIAASDKASPFGCEKGSSNFSWAGAGSTVFGGVNNKSTTKGEAGTHLNKSKIEEEESEGENEEDPEAAHDPVFEPIVPLPNKIEVRTGEEEEDKEFCSRAKFYRYDADTKEWKERGVGEMKILRHRETNTYRLLLRRDQVHKVVCNQLITADMELQSLASSDKSYCWAGMNMAEEYKEPCLEKVAVRFKDSDIAREFKQKLEECVAAVNAKKMQGRVTGLSAEGLEPEVTVEELGTEYLEGEEVEYGEEEYYDETENDTMFDKRATLHVQASNGKWRRINQGDLSIVYSSEVNMGNILFKGDGEEVMTITADHNSNIQENEKEVTWYGQDLEEVSSEGHIYKAEFSSPQAASEFSAVLREVFELSQTYDQYHGSETED